MSARLSGFCRVFFIGVITGANQLAVRVFSSAHPMPSLCRSDGENVVEPPGEEDASAGFSRRKIISNWDRYEEPPEKESESKVLLRGTDYRVLLSSAGDSFTQFRFAEEREWESENLCNKQVSGVYLDTKSLVKALQELPLHLRLNVDSDLVQEELPQELPQFKSNSISNQPPNITKQGVTGASGSSMQDLLPTPQTDTGNLPQEPQKPSLPTVDEDLDFLLGLDAPVIEETHNKHHVELTQGSKEIDLCETPENSGSPVTDAVCPAAAEKQKAVTAEDLEDWLDSMIS
ncbi:Hypothetical predicted protein [Pelobates cultripes]|uniref:Apoptosis and caspase activation inhibitor n=1 Tax=Pelobates cultripes TaxID=61616 RepID=A0AAD1TJD7_PELCU|nr:Hypothetical predicted protein [Pelobates cultripes]